MFWYMPFLSTTITSSHTSHCVVSKTKSSALLQSSDYHTLLGEHDWNTSGKGSKIPYGKGSNKKERENNSAMEELCDNQGAQCHSIKLMNDYCEDSMPFLMTWCPALQRDCKSPSVHWRDGSMHTSVGIRDGTIQSGRFGTAGTWKVRFEDWRMSLGRSGR